MTLALLDGDILTYRVAFWAQATVDGEVQLVSEENVVNKIESVLYEWTTEPGCSDYEGHLTLNSQDNFRVTLATTVPYKGNRTKQDKPVYYDFIRNYLLTSAQFCGTIGQEADDTLAQRQTALGDASCIVSIDKDMLQVPGWHWNPNKQVKVYIDEPTGFYNFCVQMLTGDRADNIVGIRGIGPVKAAGCLAKADNDYLRLKAVSDVYRQNGDDLLRHFRENASLLWLRRQTDGSPELIDTMIERLNEDIFGKAEGTKATTASQGLLAEPVPAA